VRVLFAYFLCERESESRAPLVGARDWLIEHHLFVVLQDDIGVAVSLVACVYGDQTELFVRHQKFVVHRDIP
jgi:hypothetical protein